MSYNIKYYSTFKDKSNNTYLINLKKLNYTGSTTELTAAKDVLIIDTPDAEKFEAVKGEGATLRFISNTDRQLLDLYTANYKEWQVEILKNSSTFFTGYIEPELYEESFKYSSNYEVQITCNNGIGILSREKYLNSDGTKIEGLTSVFDVISKIISKIGLDYSSLKIATDLSINSISVNSDKSILQYIAVNNDNYIDEDDNAFSCRKVLETVLSPLSLSFFVNAGKIWIVDTEYLNNSSISYKSFGISNSVVSTSCTNSITSVNLDLAGLQKYDSSFNIQAGYNNLILKKNRYIKEILSKTDFSDEENYTGDEYDNVWKLQHNTILDISYADNEDAPKNWLHKLTSFKDYYNNSATTPNKSTATRYYPTAPDEVCFAGGMKAVKTVDSIDINYDEDDTSFENWFIINNPLKAFWDSPDVNGIHYRESFFDQNNTGQLDKIAFKYTGTVPSIFNSNDVNLNLKFTSKFLSVGVVDNSGNYGAINLKSLSHYPTDFSYFIVKMKVFLKDNDSSIAYFLKNSYPNATSDTSVHLDVNTNSASYEWIAYTGQTDTFCNFIIHGINEAGNGVNLLNQDITNTLSMPGNYSNIKKLDIEFYNTFYSVAYNEDLPSGHLQEHKMYKETIPYLCYKDIYTTVVNSISGEEIQMNDEEIEYYLSDTYKTESKTKELLNYSAENSFITDVAGMMIGNNSSLSVLNYITSVTANGVTKTNLEDLVGDKYIRQYQNNQVVLSASVNSENINLLHTFTINGDAFWNSKKWIVTAINNNVADNTIDITLQEVY